MADGNYHRLRHALFFFYTLFIFSSTFSIALAQISIGIALAIFLVVLIVERFNPFGSALKYFYGAVGIYISWLVFTSILGYNPTRSLWLARDDWLFCVIPIGIYLLQREQYRKKIVPIWSVGVALLALYGIIQHFTGVYWFKDGELFFAPGYGYRVAGNFSIAITYGNYFATAALFLLGYAIASGRKELGNWYAFMIGGSALAIIATVLSMGRGAIIAIAGGLLLFGLLAGRRYLIYGLGALAIIVTAAALVTPGLSERFTTEIARDLKGEYEGSRVFIWKNSLKVIADNPVVGVGVGNFRRKYITHLRPDIGNNRKHGHAHNDPLNIAAVSGIPGGLIFLGMWAVLFTYLGKGWRRWRSDPVSAPFILGATLASAVFFITSMTEATFADEEVRQMLMFVWAAGLWKWYNASGGSPEPKS